MKAKTRCAGMSTQHARIAVDPRREKMAVASVMEESVLISEAGKEVWLEVIVGEEGEYDSHREPGSTSAGGARTVVVRVWFKFKFKGGSALSC